jgi:hypothetical protein
MTDKTIPKQLKGHAFKKGQSGNPSGRPKGSRNAATMAAEALLDGEAESLSRKAIELAKEGDMQALKLCLDRIVPPRKSRPVSIDLPQIEEPSDVLEALSAVTTAVGKGELTPDEGQTVAALLEQTRRAQELVDLDERLKVLEEKAKR